jgi:hypothetical protein
MSYHLRFIIYIDSTVLINSFIFLHKQVKIKCQHNDKNYIDGQKGRTELVSSSLKLIAGGRNWQKVPILPATRRTEANQWRSYDFVYKIQTVFSIYFIFSITLCNACYINILNMVLAPDFERQNISLVTEQRLRSTLTSFGLWPPSRRSVTREILKPFEN